MSDGTQRATEGPWTFAEQNGTTGYCDMAQVFGPDGKTLAFIEPTIEAEDANARARLTAAAPDLLAALEYCLAEHGGFTIRGECERQALAAIARARGASDA